MFKTVICVCFVLYLVNVVENTNINHKLGILERSNLIENNSNEYDTIGHDYFQNENVISKKKRDMRYESLIRGPYNANLYSKYVELVLVYDNGMYKKMGESISKISKHAKSIVNIMNTIYAPLNIFIALVDVVTWTEQDEIQLSDNGDVTLTNFLHYRKNKLIKTHPNDNAHLITNQIFQNGVVGKALKGPICTYEYSGAISTSRGFSNLEQLAIGVAHGLGHNFGMEHDTPECECAQERCIMATSFTRVNISGNLWSSCSKAYLLLALNKGMDYCLRNKPFSLFDSPTCGNGFVEPGEQCDCGLPENCENSCCNATTCTLHYNASCATGECCDLNTCQLKNEGTLCRFKELECDLPEYCNGEREFCPPDTYKLNGAVCADGKAYCYEGLCKTQDDQCQLLWGLTGKSAAELCYSFNSKGTRHGNCGYDQQYQTYTKCEPEDVSCGMLQCKHLNERLEFGMESVAILSHSFINKNGSIIPCRTAMIDLGIDQMDPGLTPNGAKCGEAKMCINQKCEPISKYTVKGSTCPNNCNGNGWCNNEGHCHCKVGFAPPDCIQSGLGGSIDSGPASHPNEDNTTTIEYDNPEKTSESTSTPTAIDVQENKTSNTTSGCTTQNCTSSEPSGTADNKSFALSLAIEVLKAMLPTTNKTD